MEYPEPGIVRVGDDSFSYAVPPPKDNPHGTPRIYKSKVLIEQLAALLTRLAPERIVELGIYDGGSVALIAAAASPAKFVAIDLNDHEKVLLTEYLEQRDLTDRVVPYYGVDQADPRVGDILDEEFADAPLDLVIDDASHLYEPTRKSLELIFPRLRPGGVYVIEDWAAQHTLLATVVDNIIRRRTGWENALAGLAAQTEDLDPDLAAGLRESPTPDRVRDAGRLTGTAGVSRALSHLGLELVHLAAESRDIVRNVEFTQGWIEITRGEGEIDGPDWLSHGSLDLFGSLSRPGRPA